MTKKAFDKIAAGLGEAVKIARGEAKPAKLHVPANIDVKAIRAKTGLSQTDFAYQFGFTTEQVKAWEQCRSRPLGGVRAYLMMIGHDHQAVVEIFERLRKNTKRAA